MSEISLVLTDIDGTIVVPGEHDPSVVVRRAIANVQAAGISLTPATGRPYDMTKAMFHELGFKGLGIFDAGASIFDIQSGELMWQHWLEIDRLKAIAGILLPHCSLIDFSPGFKAVTPDQTSLDDIAEPAPYVFAYVHIDAKDDVDRDLVKIDNISVHIGPPRINQPGMCDYQITDINADKLHAVRELRKITHSEVDETLAIGDSSNDMPLLLGAGIKVAMGNATAELKAAADHVVGTVEQDGFAQAMEQFVL